MQSISSANQKKNKYREKHCWAYQSHTVHKWEYIILKAARGCFKEGIIRLLCKYDGNQKNNRISSANIEFYDSKETFKNEDKNETNQN